MQLPRACEVNIATSMTFQPNWRPAILHELLREGGHWTALVEIDYGKGYTELRTAHIHVLRFTTPASPPETLHRRVHP